jgi:hypothetical protein
MDPRSVRLLIGSLAEQQYMFHLLTRLLVEKKVLKEGEITARYEEKERFQFSHDLLEHLVSIGLKIDENSPSSSLQESPAVSQSEGKEASDPESRTKS